MQNKAILWDQLPLTVYEVMLHTPNTSTNDHDGQSKRKISLLFTQDIAKNTEENLMRAVEQIISQDTAYPTTASAFRSKRGTVVTATIPHTQGAIAFATSLATKYAQAVHSKSTPAFLQEARKCMGCGRQKNESFVVPMR